MALTVEQLQNSQPTDWSKFDQDLHGRSSGDNNRFKDDAKLHVRFYSAPVIDVEASNAANRAIYKQAEMVEIMMPGEKHNIIRDLVWDQHRTRFPEKYAAFKAGLSQDIGSPLAVLPFLSEAQVKELEFFNIKTVEQLAGMADSVVQRFMGADRLKQRAAEWLGQFNSGATVRKELEAAQAETERKLADKDREIAELKARFERMEQMQAQAKQAQTNPPQARR